MEGTDYLCPHCGAELRGDLRKGGSRPGGTPGCPYDGLAYASLRAGHDAIYFGPWRRIDAPPTEIRRAYHRIGRHLDAIGSALAGHDLPAAASDAPGLRLITHLAVEQAHVSDAHALIPAIKSAKDRGLAPAEVLADSLYGSEKNIEAAKAMGTEVVAPVPGGEGKGKSSSLSEFALTDEGGIANCPMGHAPIEDVARGNHREAVFAVEHCFGCPRKKDCLIRSVRNGYGFSYDRKQVKMADAGRGKRRRCSATGTGTVPGWSRRCRSWIEKRE